MFIVVPEIPNHQPKGGLKPGLLGGGEVGDVSRNSTVLAPAYSLLKQEQLQLTQASFGFRKSNIKIVPKQAS